MPYRIPLSLLACCLGLAFAPSSLWAQFKGAFENPPNFPIEDRQAITAPRSWVELFGGDRLPGQVIGHRHGAEMPLERLPAHLLVRIDPEAVQSPHAVVRVRAQAVRKVVWQPRRSDEYNPATLYLQDERKVPFRALRWVAEGVTLLLPEGGIRNVPFTDIAELHLPRRDPWSVYHETLAVLSPACSNRLLRFSTNHGLVLTGTLERSQESGGAAVLQPAWCLEPVGFPPRQLRWWQLFWPHQVPLSLIEPLRAEQRSPLQGVRSWQADQNVKLQPLRSGGKMYARGFGMQSDCELEFELPTTVRGFSAHVGMDELASARGCGRGRVHVNSSAEQPLWQSKVLVGSRELIDTERLRLQGPAQGQKTLILVAEAPATGRPADADPLNIRSFVDWIEPCLELDPGRVRDEVQRVFTETVPAWQDWTVATGRRGIHVGDRWDVHDPAKPCFRREVVAPEGMLLARQVEIGQHQNYLCLSLCREPAPAEARRNQSSDSWVEVRVNGRPVAELTVPQWERDTAGRWFEPTASFVPLLKYRGKTIKIEVEQHPPDRATGAIEWRGLELVPSPALVSWVPVEVVSARAEAPETTLVQEPDHTLFAATKDRARPPRTDAYTIVADTKLTEISAFRLELLPDPRLPSHGPGRTEGHVFLSEFKVSAAPRDKPDQAEELTLTAVGTEHDPGNPPAAAVDGLPQTGWRPLPTGRPHAIVFTPAQDLAFPGGARLTFTLEQNLSADRAQAGRSPGRFRLLATAAPRPIPVARPGFVLERPGLRTLFEDEFDFALQLNQGAGKPALETKDRYSGSAALKIGDGVQCQHSRFLGEIRIRRQPGRGEYRYLQFAWKKPTGVGIGLQLANNGKYGPEEPGGPTFRYHSGPYKPWGSESLQVSDKVPTDWVLVTRDLFADFGEFTLTGLSLDGRGSSEALYDHVRLARRLEDFEDE